MSEAMAMAKTMAGEHLLEEQIDEALMGCLAEAAVGHLMACALCQQQVAAARLPIESFKTLSLAWSERRSATLPTALPQSLLQGVARRRRVAWGATATALLAVLVMLPAGVRYGMRGGREAAGLRGGAAMGATGASYRQETGAVSSEEQLARDNQMLHEIEQEVNSSGVDPATLGLGAVSIRTGTVRSSGTTQD